MIGSGVFDQHPKLQVLIVQMGGQLASILERFSSSHLIDGFPESIQRDGEEYRVIPARARHCGHTISMPAPRNRTA
jgi:hypothetical protein